jgi:hypothetical protein
MKHISLLSRRAQDEALLLVYRAGRDRDKGKVEIYKAIGKKIGYNWYSVARRIKIAELREAKIK